MPSEPSHSADRFPALDGLRGLAVLLVMWGHTTVMTPACGVDRVYKLVTQAGWLGVDLFFVLSGFLITGILLDTRGRKGWLGSFCARRALRIIPLAYLVILIACVIVPNLPRATSPPWSVLRDICLPAAENQAWLWSFLGNVQIARAGWCFGPLDAMWSLGVEEQFYLAWPLVVMALGRRGVLWLSGGLFVLALALRGVLLARGVSADATCVLTPTRLDGLVIGAMIACVQREGGLERLVPLARGACVVIPAVLVAMGVVVGRFTLHDRAVLTAGVSLAAVLFGAMVVLAVEGKEAGIVRRVFTNRFLRWTGKYSYALYLLHWPVHAVVMHALFRIDDVPLVMGSRLGGAMCYYAVVWSGAYALSLLSWWAWESRFLAFKRFVPRPGSRPGGAATSPTTIDR